MYLPLYRRNANNFPRAVCTYSYTYEASASAISIPTRGTENATEIGIRKSGETRRNGISFVHGDGVLFVLATMWNRTESPFLGTVAHLPRHFRPLHVYPCATRPVRNINIFYDVALKR